MLDVAPLKHILPFDLIKVSITVNTGKERTERTTIVVIDDTWLLYVAR